uniref:Morphogenetic protein n=1 Tax=Mycena chlorophos TaxID=658473 RepID=A0ABQ0L0A2_MYCCL|nr:predicted protein [Mycena chlorophos]
MVRAILEGRKTVTRRIVKGVRDDNNMVLKKATKTRCGIITHVIDAPKKGLCPYGNVGDRLWVKETWGAITGTWDENDNLVDWNPDRPAQAIREMPYGNGYYTGHVIYRADGEHEWAGDDDGYGEPRSAWKPSIHMPRAASRIILEVTDVRVELLQDTTDSDAEAEGIERRVIGDGWREYGLDPRDEAAGTPPMLSARDSFRSLWESLNGAGSWEATPWVWRVEFKQIEVAA